MKLKLLEPLRELFKDEVRNLGLALDLPAEMVRRHPFPGPGLGVRILGEIHKEHADLLRRADAIFIEELRRDDLYDKVSQAFAVFLPVRSVGVMGDGRRYDHVIALRAVETIDFMTARWARLPYDFLDRVTHRIVNEVPGISTGGVRHLGEAAGDDRVGVTQIICKSLVFMSSFAYDLAWFRWSTISMNALSTGEATLRATRLALRSVFRSAIFPQPSRG